MNKLFGWIKDHAATILSWGATAGTICGAVEAARAMPKAQERIGKAYQAKSDRLIQEVNARFEDDPELRRLKEEEPREWFAQYEEAMDDLFNSKGELTKWEKIKAGAPAFLWTGLIELATIGCIHGSDKLHCETEKKLNRTIKGLNESLAAATAVYAVYRDSIGCLTDRPTEAMAEKMAEERMIAQKQGDDRPPWEDKRSFYIDGQPEFFERTMEEIYEAELRINQRFIERGEITLNEIYREFRLPEIPEGDRRGFDAYLGEVWYGYLWIDFSHRPYQADDGMWVTEIAMPIDPHPLTEAEVEAELNEAIGVTE